jgi:hypothetical protein
MPSKSKTVSTTEQRLPGNQQANVDLLQSGANTWFQSGGPQFYNQNTVAGPTANQLAGREAALSTAGNIGGFIDTARQGDQFWLNPANVFNPSNIPGFQAAQDSVVQNTVRALTENILPTLRSGSVASGTYGGTRQGIGEGLAVGRTSDALAGQLGRMQMDAFNQSLNMYNAAQGRVPQQIASSFVPSTVQQEIGAAERADQQQQIDADRQRWEHEQMAPLFALQQLQQLTGSMGQYGGTTTQTNVSKTPFNPMQLVGGAAALAGGVGQLMGGAGQMGWRPFA